MSERTHIFVDGENLVFRYQDMLESDLQPTPGALHIQDVAIWSNKLYDGALAEIKRINYYTSTVGDQGKIDRVHDQIQSWRFSSVYNRVINNGRLIPKIFKKQDQRRKSRSVDIQITIDSLVSAYTHEVDRIVILTCDGDFIPLIKQIMRLGKQVSVGALSSGLHPGLKRIPDHFVLLDDYLLQK